MSARKTRTQNGKPLKDNSKKHASIREHYERLRHATNLARAKQVWVGGTTAEGGHWERT